MIRTLTLTLFCMLSLATFLAPHAYAQDTTKVRNEPGADDEDAAPVAAHKQKKTVSKIEEAPVAFGLIGGLNQAEFVIGGTASGAVNGILVGGIMDVHVGGVVHLETGLHYAMTGSQLTYYLEPTTWKINTIELPAIWQFKFGKPGMGHFFFGLGGYAALNVSGTDANGGTLVFGTGSNANLKAFDAGILFDIGYQLKDGLLFRIKGQGGLPNLNPQSESATIRTSAGSIEVGYLFGQPKKKHHHIVRSSADSDVEMKM